jgi:hypothetical protein
MHGGAEMAVVTTTFQQGVNGYSSTLDTMLQQKNPTAASGTISEIGADKDSGAEKQVLLKFDDLFGTGPGQIPVGAIITSASLTLRTTSASLQGASLYRMMFDWDGTSTWNSLGNGVQTDGVEAAAVADLTTGQTTTGSRAFDITNSLQAWATSGSTSEARNAANQGWLFKANGTDGWDFRSSEGSVKPLLSVTYTLPDAPPPPVVGITVTQSGGTTAVAEGGAGDSFTLALASAPTADVIITVNGAEDLNGVPATLVFTPTNWQMPQTVTLMAEDDTQVEGSETVSITLVSSSTDTRYDNFSIAPIQVEITDNDNPPQPTVSVEDGSPDVQTEGPNARIAFTFTLDHASDQAVTVKYLTMDGTATAGGDFYGLTDGSITFLPGEVSKTIDIQLVDDTMNESLESFFVQINSAENALVGVSNAVGYIEDNDEINLPPSQPSVVKIFDATQYKAGDPSGYGSGDPSGICYVPTMDALFMCDSEHDESPYNSTTNLFVLKRDGSHTASFSMRSYTKEPTGVAFNPTNGYLYVTDDDKDKVYWVNPNNPSVKIGEFSVSGLGIADAEDPKFDPVTGNMFLLDGVSRRFFELTSQGKLVSSMSLPSQMKDAEALAYDASSKVFYIASGAGTNIYKMSRSGEILKTIDILGSSAYLNPITGSKPVPKGLELAPSSDPNDGGRMSLFVADYGVDQKNDGRLFEINLGSDWLLA